MKNKYYLSISIISILLFISFTFNITLYRFYEDSNKYKVISQNILTENKTIKEESKTLYSENSKLKVERDSLTKQLDELQNPEAIQSTNRNVNNNSDDTNESTSKVGDTIKLSNTTIVIKSVKYSNTFSFLDAINGMKNNVTASKDETFGIITAEITTKLKATDFNQQKWVRWDFINIIADKGYNPGGGYDNPHPATIYTNKTNKIQISVNLNKGDKIATIIIKEPGSNNNITVKVN